MNEQKQLRIAYIPNYITQETMVAPAGMLTIKIFFLIYTSRHSCKARIHYHYHTAPFASLGAQ